MHKLVLRPLFALLALLSLTLPSRAEERRLDPIHIDLEARGSYHLDYVAGTLDEGRTGFRGDIFNFIMWGELAPRLEYKARVRLNGVNSDYSFFDATDWLYLSYKLTDHLSILAGKWTIYVAGWEPELAPIDCFQLSVFLYHIPCYAWGVTGFYTLPGEKDTLGAQLCESPFRREWQQKSGTPASMYAYNFFWEGSHGWYDPLWSTNVIEYQPGKFINYLYLGNRFNIGSKTELDIDLGNRATFGQKPFFFSDYSLTARLKYYPSDYLKLILRAGYDTNKSGLDADYVVTNGTEISQVGCGVEYFPYGDNRLRLHGNIGYAFGTNTHPEAAVLDREMLLDMGLTWRIHAK